MECFHSSGFIDAASGWILGVSCDFKMNLPFPTLRRCSDIHVDAFQILDTCLDMSQRIE
jgi:hypothetical protein